jgi:hypothetical protein
LTRKYPLELLQRARAAKVDATSRELAGASVRAASAEGEVARRMQAKVDFEAAVEKTKGSERGRLEEGLLAVTDLERAASFSAGADLERARKERAVDDARAALARARREAEEKRQALVHSQAGAKLVEQHHDKWDRARSTGAAARDEENANEAHAALQRSKEER